MKKKGFTLIELLAVIVILAIIALIATPLVLKYIEYSKEKSAKLSAQTYTEAVEKEYVSKLTNNEKMPNKEYTIKELDELGVKVKGDKPKGDNDYVVLNNGNVTEYELTINGYVITYKNGEVTVGSNEGVNTGCVESVDYTVKFMVDGEPYEIVSVKKGNFVTEPNEPLKADLVLKSWDDEDGNAIKFPFTPTSDTELRASFELATIQHQLEFDTYNTQLFLVDIYKFVKTIDGISIAGYWTVTEDDGKKYTYIISVSETPEQTKCLKINRNTTSSTTFNTPEKTIVTDKTFYYIVDGKTYGNVDTVYDERVINLNDYLLDSPSVTPEQLAQTLIKIYLGYLPLKS